jgi:hypothetical protein
VTGWRHLRLVADGDDVDPPPPPPPRRRWSARDEALYERTYADLCRSGWHPAAAAVEAGATVERERKARP